MRKYTTRTSAAVLAAPVEVRNPFGMSKIDTVRAAIKTGDKKTALKIASDFRGGIEDAGLKVVKRGYECLVHPDFYRQTGTDPETAVDAAWELLKVHPLIVGKPQ
jgi:hypothetical protein